MSLWNITIVVFLMWYLWNLRTYNHISDITCLSNRLLCGHQGITLHPLVLVFHSTAYFLGMIVTFAVMLISKMGQPALLYLVPFTLLTSAVVAWSRKEMQQFWAGTTYQVGVQIVNSKPSSVCLTGRAMLNRPLTFTQAWHLAGGDGQVSCIVG